MGEIAGAGIVFGIAVVLAVSGWRRRDESPLFILRLLPATLLLVSLPAWLTAIDILRGLQRIADTGSGGAPEVEVMVRSSGNVLVTALTAMVLAAGITAALQAFATGVAASDDEPPPHRRTETWLLVAPSLAAVPTAGLVYLVHDVATLLVGAAVQVTSAHPDLSVRGMDMAQLSSYLAQRLLLAIGLGGVTNLGLFVMIPTLLFLARSRRRRGPLDVYAWVVLALVVGAGTWAGFVTLRDVQGLHGQFAPR